MTTDRYKKREKVNVWMAIDITLVVAALRLWPSHMRGMEDFAQLFTRFPVVDWALNLLFFWLLGLLWLAYRQWRVSPVCRTA